MNFIQKIRSYFSLNDETYLFTDHISGNKVYSYTDCYGNKWMKDSRWGLFSVKMEPTDTIDVLAEAYDLLTNYRRVE